MMEHETRLESDPTSVRTVRAAAHIVVVLGVWGALLFWAAGTLAWVRAWFLVGLWVVALAANLAILVRTSPETVAARITRRRPGAKSEIFMLPAFVAAVLAIPIVAGLDAVRYAWTSAPPWTVLPAMVIHAIGKAFVVWATVVAHLYMPSILAAPIVAGLDLVRYSWTSALSWTIWPAVGVLLAGNAVVLWAMAANPFVERRIRIQRERGHRVITAGPYAIVRHPMYVGLILMLAGVPLLLGSLWAFLPVAMTTVLLVIRTALEDRMLREELAGYEAYAQKTVYRLIPGIW